MKKSLLLSAIIFSQTLVFATENHEHSKEAKNLGEAISEGKISGGLALYGQKKTLKYKMMQIKILLMEMHI